MMKPMTKTWATVENCYGWERCKQVQAKEEKQRRESEQIAEVYEYMTGETGMTEMKKDEVVRDKEIDLIVISETEEKSKAEKEHISSINNGGLDRCSTENVMLIKTMMLSGINYTHAIKASHVHTF